MNLRFIKIDVILFGVFLVSQTYGQVYKYKETYPNGQLKYKGKYRLCVTQEDKYPYIFNHEERKFGKWIAYYPSGVISEIRHYTKRCRNCDQAILKEGEWKYFTQEGIQYRLERYSKDSLIYSEMDIYNDQTLTKKIIIRKNSRDTVFYHQLADDTNLVLNPSFEEFFYKPVRIQNDGKDQIENLLPYWYSPDTATPDYYNKNRKVKGVPDHLDASLAKDRNGYVGLMLYIGEKKNQPLETIPHRSAHIDYAECLQSGLRKELKKGRKYCFRAEILLSRNSGYSINQFGVTLTNDPLYFRYSDMPGEATLSFDDELDNTESWHTLCRGFIAEGGERYITLGRLSELEATEVKINDPIQISELDINRSAYYLLDNVELFEIDTASECGCDSRTRKQKEITENFTKFEEVDLALALEKENRFVLSNIFFEFDRANIKKESIPELIRLRDYLKLNPSVEITIYGHTDNTGTEQYNLDLSEKRAIAIRDWLVNKGITGERITSQGLGDKSPLFDNSTEANRKINRRVEFLIRKE